jgi:CRP-like cAMP-binding protein
LANVARDYHYDAGDVVVAEGDQSGRFHLIVSGRATVTVGDQVVAEFGPGSYFGELAMIDRQPRSATVTAAEELHTLSLASISMRPVLREHPEISFKMLEKLAARLRATDAKLH